MSLEKHPRHEYIIILLLGAVQFVNVLDFMMVMPLGPDFAKDLGIPLSNLGYIGGSYTFAACISGLLGSFYLDKFDRKVALILALIGLSFATILGGLSTGMNSLMLARVLAGTFGGPATSISLSIVADIIPVHRRGRAMGTVFAAFSLASIFGVPVGLEIARLGGWKMPFFVIGSLGLFIGFLAYMVLPVLRGHIESTPESFSTILIEFRKSKYWIAWLIIGTSVFGNFMIVPNISAYVQFNWGWPREKLGLLYLVAGLFSLLATKYGGLWADRRGSLRPSIAGTLLLFFSITAAYVFPQMWISIYILFTSYMMGNNLRFVAFNTLVSQVPQPRHRARYMSMQSAIQHLASASGSFLAASVLIADSSGRLERMNYIGMGSMVLALAAPIGLVFLDRAVKAQPISAGPLSHHQSGELKS